MKRLLLIALAVVAILSAAIVFAAPSDLSPPLVVAFAAIGAVAALLCLGLSLHIQKGLRGLNWKGIVNWCSAVPAVIVSGVYVVARGPTIIMSLCLIDDPKRRGSSLYRFLSASKPKGAHLARGFAVMNHGSTATSPSLA